MHFSCRICVTCWLRVENRWSSCEGRAWHSSPVSLVVCVLAYAHFPFSFPFMTSSTLRDSVRAVRGCFEYQSNGNSRSRDEGAIRPTSKSFVVGWAILVRRTVCYIHRCHRVRTARLALVCVRLTAGLGSCRRRLLKMMPSTISGWIPSRFGWPICLCTGTRHSLSIGELR